MYGLRVAQIICAYTWTFYSMYSRLWIFCFFFSVTSCAVSFMNVLWFSIIINQKFYGDNEVFRSNKKVIFISGFYNVWLFHSIQSRVHKNQFLCKTPSLKAIHQSKLNSNSFIFYTFFFFFFSRTRKLPFRQSIRVRTSSQQ